MATTRLEAGSVQPGGVLNFNIGLLGHVDSGKTSLAKVLSTIASTACFDKNPQSRERGITIDLGFSSFAISLPDHLKSDAAAANKSVLQYTLVDCPGHASLIKTIIGGSQIIDLMILVIDVTKGMQTQTAECLVIGEITCDHLIVVLNKCDLLPKDKRESMIEKMTKRMRKTLETTKFSNCSIVPVSANPESQEGDSDGIENLIEVLEKNTYVPKREASGPFIFAVDHCFVIRGQGTVMTGTMLSGCVKINENIEIPQLKVTKKVKSIQMFKKPVDKIIQGDRAGICVTQFDPSTIERGIICSPGSLPILYAVIIKATKIRYFKGKCSTKAKFHISLGHETVMAKVLFFSSQNSDFNTDEEYLYEEELAEESNGGGKHQYALLEFEQAVITASKSLVIASKLDTDIHSNICRLAFQGAVVLSITDKSFHTTVLPKLKIFKNKSRDGIIERKVNSQTVICKNIFKKETNVDKFAGLKVTLSTGEQGIIEGSFGQSGKAKINIHEGLSEETEKALAENSKKKGKDKDADENVNGKQLIKVILKFKRYVYDPDKKMIQT